MATPTFYHSDLTDDNALVHLDANELQHARQSRRLKVGYEVRLLNGKGLISCGRVVELSKRKFVVEPHQRKMGSHPVAEITVAVAVPKGDRQRFMIESLTQLGVARIQPIECSRSVSNNVKATLKWQRYAIEAIKQSQNPWLPEVSEPLSLEQWVSLEKDSSAKLKLLADSEGVPVSELVEKRNLKNRSCNVIIGPEGGLTKDETQLLVNAGYLLTNLGANILRIEVAAISFVALWRSHIKRC